MKTYSANSIAEQFETDRGVVVRALRNVKADAVVSGKPQWKIVTAAAALEKHRAKNRGGSATGPDPDLAKVYAVFDAKFTAMSAAPTLAKRRAMAVKLGPVLADMDRKVREAGLANGQDGELVHLRADRMFMLALRGFEAPCGWTLGQAQTEIGG
jgi:hypothetical protein